MRTRDGRPITLRPAGEADRDFLLRVYASTRRDELARTSWAEPEKEAFARWQGELQDTYYREHYPTCAFQVIVIDGKEAGRFYIDRWPEEHRLVDITLLPEARGMGAGEALLRALQAEAAGAGKPLSIHVERFNPALRLYQRLGFSIVGDRGVYLFLVWRPEAAAPDASPRRD